MKRTIATVLGLLMALSLTGCGFKGQKTPEAGNAADTQEITQADIAAGNQSPSGESVTAEPKDYREDMYDYYQQQIDRIAELNASGRNQETAAFTLYDLDEDGIPELLLNGGYKTNAYEQGILVYSYFIDKGGFEAGSINRAAQAFFDKQPGDGEINVICVHHNTMAEMSYRIVNEKLTETVVTDWHERTDEEYDAAMNAVKNLRILDQEWTPLSEAAGYFGDLLP